MQAWTRNVSRRVVPRVTVKDIPGCTSEQKVLPFRRNPTQEILNLVFSEQSDSLGVWTDDHVVNDHHQKVYPFNDTAALAQRSGHSQGKKASSIFMNRQIKKTPEIPPPQPVSASDYFQTILPDPIILKAAQQQRLALNTTRVPSDDYSPAIATSSPDSLADTQPAVSHSTVLPAIRQERSWAYGGQCTHLTSPHMHAYANARLSIRMYQKQGDGYCENNNNIFSMQDL